MSKEFLKNIRDHIGFGTILLRRANGYKDMYILNCSSFGDISMVYEYLYLNTDGFFLKRKKDIMTKIYNINQKSKPRIPINENIV